MQIIDAQIHQAFTPPAWDLSDSERLALAADLAIEAMDAVGVDAALLNAGEDFIEVAVRRYPGRFAGCGFVAGGMPNSGEFVAGYLNRPGRKAVRVTVRNWLTGELDDDFRAGRLEPVLAIAEENNVPVCLSAQGHPDAVAGVAERHPGLTIIVDHLGLPQRPMEVDMTNPWALLPAVNRLAQYPNVAIKFSGGPTLSSEAYPFHDVWDQLRSMVDAFGASRLMWGSDYTRMRVGARSTARIPRREWATSYLDSVCFVRDTDVLSAEEKEYVLGGTIRNLLGWKPDAD